MFTVVIIDDEPIIAEEVLQEVPWEQYGCRVVGTAQYGDEGTRVLRESRPDILFLTLSSEGARGMDGLAIIAALRVQYPNMMLGILDGCRDAGFAESALRLGATRCLGKPFCAEEFAEALAAMTEQLAQTGSAGAGAGSFIVRNALSYMEQNYREHLTLGEVAENTYVSQWHLSKLLNRYTGKNFSELLNHVRIGHAKELLKGSTLRIGEIAETVGFVDIAHFSRVFKKMEGISANEYRNKRNQEEKGVKF